MFAHPLMLGHTGNTSRRSQNKCNKSSKVSVCRVQVILMHQKRVRRMTARAPVARLLQPWLSVLHALQPRLELQHVPSRQSANEQLTLWIGGATATTFRLGEASPLDRICETLSLLSLLARVDLREWKATIFSVWPVADGLGDLIDGPQVFRCGFVSIGMPQDWVESSKRSYEHVEPSEEYTRLRKALESKLAAQDAQDVSHMSVSAQIRPVESGLEALPIQRIVESVQSRPRIQHQAPGIKKPVFVISDVGFPTNSDFTLDMDGLRHLRELAISGVRLHNAPLSSMRPHTHELADFVTAVRDILGLDVVEDRQKASARAFCIHNHRSTALFPALLSAVQCSSSVSTLTVDFGDDGRSWSFDNKGEWKWIAYAIFSPHADHKIDTLQLNTSTLEHSDVDMIRRVVHARNPLAVVRGQADKPHPEGLPRFITTSHFMLQDGEDTAEVPLTRRHLRVRVMASPVSGYPYWTVLLPGYGEALVHEDSVISISDGDLPTEPVIPSMSRIEITKMADYSRDSTAELLQIIGRGTQRIDLHSMDGNITIDAWCGRVLQSCPRLQVLHIREAFLENLAVFVEWAACGLSQLQELSVSSVLAGTGNRIRQFFDTLSDPSHELSKSLRIVMFTLRIETMETAEMIKSIVRTLRSNRRLHKVHLTITIPRCYELLKSKFETALEEFKGECVFIVQKQQSSRQKLAFLSVLSQLSGSMTQFDSSVIAIVFEFARDTRLRIFSYSVDCDDD